MSKLNRFGVSMEQDLLDLFDRDIKAKGYRNRSEAIRDLIRQAFVREQWRRNERVAGAVLLLYDHHRRDLVEKILMIQHDFQEAIISAQHIHLDHHHCLEIIAAKGKAALLGSLRDALKSLKGVKHVALSMTATGERLL